ncbi:MAG: metalloregulator ArsR/SmtB family transcription factor [Proteobacteria bacterium]|nr:metalloregulator ArsR/SmtB family transcription factor [Pseudomonadota bacterium]MBU4277201.1 metalloregulator ArsR/SmtB family transcription factor [Pseudomonadota bacterium]MBU4385313.1 metalloregulator ArsR/SmtB family transcription factor [Pseudomonadota bacterium]MBU4605565.1 metalloregulator ArsR/SmtB family transcription factor [Pseudomonadota bacterium]MCG2764557.1 metalloregulator ArsR/SmtB family transcription factor [Desulfarculaceae bacterium]
MSSLAESQQRADAITELIKAIAHPVRLRIISLLCQSDQRVIFMASRLEKTPAAVSQQLRILRMSGLVSTERRGGEVYYTLARPQLRQLLACLDGCQAA